MNDPYGLEASGLPPELVAQLLGSDSRKKIAEALLRQSMQAPEVSQPKGRFQGVVSPLEHLAKLTGGVVARGGIDRANAEREAVGAKMAAGERAAMEAYQRQSQGAPEVPYNDALGSEAPQGPIDPGMKADPRAAIINARMSPYIKNAKFLDSAESNLNRVEAREDSQANMREMRLMQQEQRKFELQQAQAAKLEQIRVAAEEGRISKAEADARAFQARQEFAKMMQAFRQPPAPITQTDAAGNVTFYNRSGEVIKRHEGAGKPSATFEKTQKERKDTVRDLDSTISELKSISGDGGLLDQSTGSGIGRGIDMAAGLVGVAPDGAVAAARLAPIADKALKMVPRFEGPQSDKDTQSYKEAAGQLANASLPPRIRKAAALEIVRLMEARRGQFVGDDGAGAGPAAMEEKTIGGKAYVKRNGQWFEK